jgi:hypothetical protein
MLGSSAVFQTTSGNAVAGGRRPLTHMLNTALGIDAERGHAGGSSTRVEAIRYTALMQLLGIQDLYQINLGLH